MHKIGDGSHIAPLTPRGPAPSAQNYGAPSLWYSIAMTIVIAKQFNDTICIVSDTMITDAEGSRNKIIPGRLKAIILNERFSVAYAGHSDPAQYAIRDAHQILRSRGGSDAVLQRLRNATTGAADIDFITASHYPPNVELRRIWEGRISDPLSQAVIGNSTIYERITTRFVPSGNGKVDARNFWSAFIETFTNSRVDAGMGVGGVPIGLVAAPDNHHYASCSVNANWKPIGFVPGRTTYEDEQDLLTGEWSYHFDVVPPARAGAAVIAVAIRQAKTGYIYAPLIQDDASSITLIENSEPWTQHQGEMFDVLNSALEAKLAEHLEKLG